MSNYNYQGEDFWVSPYNGLVPDTQKLAKVEIHDATLRDGEQTPGVVFRKEDKIKIARALDELGVDRIEAGMPVVSQDDFDAIKEIANMGLNAKVVGFCRANVKDIEAAAKCGVWGIGIEIPSGAPRLKWQFNWSHQEVIDKSLTVIERAKQLGLKVIYFPFDTTRSDPDFFRQLIKAVAEEGKPDSIVLVDTLGCTLPSAIQYMVKEIRKITDIPLEIHGHNDFGLAVANSLAAVEAGVSVIQGCMNGLGERTGNAPLEEIILCLKYLYGYDLKIDLSKLKGVSQLVAELANKKVDPYKPAVGQNIFSREIGLGIKMLKNSPLAVFPFKPEVVGLESSVLLGKKSGRDSIEVKAEEFGLKLSDDETQAIVQEIKARSIKDKRNIGDEEFIEIAKAVSNK